MSFYGHDFTCIIYLINVKMLVTEDVSDVTEEVSSLYSIAFQGNVTTTKSQTGNIWASVGFESAEKLATLSDNLRKNQNHRK